MSWIFGYGSLIWRPAFPFSKSRKAVIRGWRRRFWQASPDHRGVPDAPGRVVTLVEEAEAICWGRAFLLHEIDRERVIAQLDEREKNGYRQIFVDIEFEDASSEKGCTYIAGPGNPSFIGPAPVVEMAAQISAAKGPSGPNVEYLRRLADALRDMNVHDDEVHSLSLAVEQFAGS